MHKNTSLLVVGLALLLAVVVGIRITAILFPQKETATPKPTVASEPVMTPSLAPQLLVYTNESCGFSVSYPKELTKLETDSGAIFGNTETPSDTVTAICQTEIPRVPLPDDKMETVSIGSTSATLYHDASAKDGTPIDKLIFTHPSKNLDIYIAGFGTTYDSMIASLRLLP